MLPPVRDDVKGTDTTADVFLLTPALRGKPQPGRQPQAPLSSFGCYCLPAARTGETALSSIIIPEACGVSRSGASSNRRLGSKDRESRQMGLQVLWLSAVCVRLHNCRSSLSARDSLGNKRRSCLLRESREPKAESGLREAHVVGRS